MNFRLNRISIVYQSNLLSKLKEYIAINYFHSMFASITFNLSKILMAAVESSFVATNQLFNTIVVVLLASIFLYLYAYKWKSWQAETQFLVIPIFGTISTIITSFLSPLLVWSFVSYSNNLFVKLVFYFGSLTISPLYPHRMSQRIEE